MNIDDSVGLVILAQFLGLAGGLSTLHWRGMLKISEAKREIGERFVKLEGAVESLKDLIEHNGFARHSDLQYLEKEMQRIRDRLDIR